MPGNRFVGRCLQSDVLVIGASVLPYIVSTRANHLIAFRAEPSSSSVANPTFEEGSAVDYVDVQIQDHSGENRVCEG